MFSCCRANPKKSKKSNENKTSETIEDVNTATNDNKQLIIPTITIENGKTTTTEDTKNTTNSMNVDIEVNANKIDEIVESASNDMVDGGGSSPLPPLQNLTTTATGMTRLEETVTDTETITNGVTTSKDIVATAAVTKDVNGIVIIV